MEFEAQPFCYLSNPLHPLSYADVESVLGVLTGIHCAGAKSFLNQATGVSEFCVYGTPDKTLAHYFPLQIEAFVPYFVWTVAVNRSKICRRFAVSMVNTMVADAVMFTGTIHWALINSQYGATYNPETMHAFDSMNV